MTDRLQAIATAAGLCIVALMAWALLNTAEQAVLDALLLPTTEPQP